MPVLRAAVSNSRSDIDLITRFPQSETVNLSHDEKERGKKYDEQQMLPVCDGNQNRSIARTEWRHKISCATVRGFSYAYEKVFDIGYFPRLAKVTSNGA